MTGQSLSTNSLLFLWLLKTGLSPSSFLHHLSRLLLVEEPVAKACCCGGLMGELLVVLVPFVLLIPTRTFLVVGVHPTTIECGRSLSFLAFARIFDAICHRGRVRQLMPNGYRVFLRRRRQVMQGRMGLQQLSSEDRPLFTLFSL